MRKAQATHRELGLASAILLLLALYLYLAKPSISSSGGILFTEKCVLNGNLSCSSAYLGRDSKLELVIAQNTGKTINITSVVCTKNESQQNAKHLNLPVLITSGERAYVSGGNSNNTVICTEADGKSTQQARLGDLYSGNLYIYYMDKNGVTSFINGTLVTKYS